MLRGEVWWVDFDPSVGAEIQRIRLAELTEARLPLPHASAGARTTAWAAGLRVSARAFVRPPS
jgi:hypothetical protein